MTSAVASASFAAHVAGGHVTCVMCKVQQATGVVSSGRSIDIPGPIEWALCGGCQRITGRSPGDAIDQQRPAQEP